MLVARRRWLTGLVAGALGSVLVASSVSACSVAPDRSAAHQQPVKSFAPHYGGKPKLAPPDMTDDGPGSLVSVEPYATGGSELLDTDNATYMRVVYRSTSGIDGSPTEVSMSLAIPPGTPPKGGWPIMGFGQGTKGVNNKCASSLYPSLPLNAWTMDVFVKSGYLVVASDFQGSGVKGVLHPFLDAKTYGYNFIDSVKAARRIGVPTQNNWLAYGHSAGGLAAWSATELAPTYGKGMNLLGTVAMAPAADMVGLADMAWNETLSGEQRLTLVFLLQSLKWFHPEMNLDDFRSGSTAQHWDEVLDCTPSKFSDIELARSYMTNDGLKPKSYADVIWLRNQLVPKAIGYQRVETPTYIGYGTDDVLVNESWFVKALERSCAVGSNLEIHKGPGKGHADLDSGFTLGWLNDRLMGVAAPPSNCEQWQKTVAHNPEPKR